VTFQFPNDSVFFFVDGLYCIPLHLCHIMLGVLYCSGLGCFSVSVLCSYASRQDLLKLAKVFSTALISSNLKQH
jgi:hypothetical protein